MRTSLRHGLLLLSIAAAAPAAGQAPQRAQLGPIVPCEATAPVLQPSPRSGRISSDDGGARPLFGSPRSLDFDSPRPGPAAPAGGIRLVSQTSHGETFETVPAQPRSTPAPLPAPVDSAPVAAPPSPYPGMWSAPSEYVGPSNDGPVGPPGTLWFVPEFVYWQVRGQQVPPLITTAPLGTPLPGAGTLGNPSTQILYGNEQINDPWRPGLRLRAGFWFDRCQARGLEASWFFLERGADAFRAGFNGDPGVFRPFFNADGTSNSELIAFQDPALNPVVLTPVVAGQVIVHARNTIQGGDINYRHLLRSRGDARVDLLLGYRYMTASDSITIAEGVTATNANPPPGFPLPGTIIIGRDSFATRDTFNGGQIGLTGERWAGAWFVAWTGKVALGNTDRTATIDGLTQVFPSAGGSTLLTGGLLAQGSNIGRYTSSVFSVIPEVGVNLGVQLAPRLRVFTGYTFMYWTDLWRAGEQIDLVLAQIPPAPSAPPGRPMFLGESSNLWLHGVSFGAEFRY
jgi:hypothetical protein